MYSNVVGLFISLLSVTFSYADRCEKASSLSFSNFSLSEFILSLKSILFALEIVINCLISFSKTFIFSLLFSIKTVPPLCPISCA